MRIDIIEEGAVVVLYAHDIGQGERSKENQSVGDNKNEAIELSIFCWHLCGYYTTRPLKRSTIRSSL